MRSPESRLQSRRIRSEHDCHRQRDWPDRRLGRRMIWRWGAQLWAANSKPKAKRRVTDLVSDLRVGAAAQQHHHGLHFAVPCSPEKGCEAILQRPPRMPATPAHPNVGHGLTSNRSAPPLCTCPRQAAPRCALPALPPEQQADHAWHSSWPNRDLERRRQRRHVSRAADGLALLLASRSAPRSSSTATASTSPVRAAQMRAERPLCSACQPRQHPDVGHGLTINHNPHPPRTRT